MRNVVQLCLAANSILHMRKLSHAFLLFAYGFASRGYSFKKKTRWSNDKQLLNSVLASVICHCLASELFAEAEGWGK